MADPAPAGEGGTFKPRVGLLAVVGLLYASACGGPYGTENYVAETGPGLYILLMFVTPWAWGVPMALATAELSSARPVEGGYLRWVRGTLGPFWGFQAGAWTVIASFLDQALYPALFAESLHYLLPGIDGTWRWVAAVAFIGVLTYLNYRGIEIAGAAAVALNIFLMAPLVWFVIAGGLQARFNPFVPFTAPGTDFRSALGQGLTLAMWFYSGFTEVSSAAEEIKRPERIIPLALLIVAPLVVLSYVAPTVAGLMALNDWPTWESGQFATMGRVLGGRILGGWIFLGGVASFTVIFMSYLLWYSRLTWAMAADRILPRFLAKLHPKYGTPHRTLLVYALGFAMLVALPFPDLLVLNVWVFGAYDLTLVFSAVRARTVYADRPPGFRIPGGNLGIWINALVPSATWILVLAITWRDGLLPLKLLLLGAPGLISGGIRLARRRAAAR